MASNMEKYTRASIVEATKEKTRVALSASSKRSVVMTPGVFPVCAACGKDCRTLADDKYRIQVGLKETADAPLLCRACRSVLCQQCAGATGSRQDSRPCPQCGSAEGLDWLLPFVFCDKCGKRAALLSGALPGEATYMLLDKGAVPFRCTECQSISCADCLSKNNTCQNCGSSKLGFFVPGYLDTGAVIAATDPPGGHITLAVPGSAAANRARSAAEQRAKTQEEQIKRLMEDLRAPAIKFWISKEKALQGLQALGSACKPALPLVRSFLGRAEYRIAAVNVFGAAGEAAKDELRALLDMLENGAPDDAAAAAIAIGWIGPSARDAVPALRQVLDRKRARGDTGLRCASALALFVLKEMGSQEVTDIVREHVTRHPSRFPPSSYLETILTIS
jgi:hypothetical protein